MLLHGAQIDFITYNFTKLLLKMIFPLDLCSSIHRLFVIQSQTLFTRNLSFCDTTTESSVTEMQCIEI